MLAGVAVKQMCKAFPASIFLLCLPSDSTDRRGETSPPGATQPREATSSLLGATTSPRGAASGATTRRGAETGNKIY